MKIKGLKKLIALAEEKFEQFYDKSDNYQNSVEGQEEYTFLYRVESVLNDVLELNDET